MFWILKILIFDHVTVIEVVIFCCVPNFVKIGSRVRPPDTHNCWMFNAPLLGNGRCHGNRITASKSVNWCTSYSISNIFEYGGRPPSCIGILPFWTTHEVNYAVWLVWKFGVDSIYAVGDFAILWFCQFGWKVPNHAPFFWGFWGVWTF